MNEEGKGIHQVEMDDLVETMIGQVPKHFFRLSTGRISWVLPILGSRLLVSPVGL